jgi:fermentation-respiration switch protein FrsA (DUF1100 family)
MLGCLEDGISAFVLMAGTPHFADWFFYYPAIDESARKPYLRKFAAIDPVANVKHLEPAPILCQFGRQDPHVPEDKAKAFFDVAHEPKELRWYGGGIALDSQATSERLEWLNSRFDLH